ARLAVAPRGHARSHARFCAGGKKSNTADGTSIHLLGARHGADVAHHGRRTGLDLEPRVATERCIVAALERCAAFPCFCARLGASVRARFPGGFHRMNELEQELKRLLIEVLNLEDITVEQIDSQAP